MPIKLVYFPVQAEAEAIRMAFAYGKVQYEDLLPTDHYGVGWMAGAKDKTPFGGLPALQLQGC